jgi:hypothetical protein
VQLQAPTSPSAATEPEPDDDGRPHGRRRPLTQLVVLGIVVLLVSMWGYVLYLAFGPGRQPPADRLDDPAFAQAAEDRCAEAVAEVDELPIATESPTADARADVVEQANAVYAAMLQDLDGLAGELVPAGDQRERTREWLDDWGTYLDDRVAYVAALRSDPQARFLISEKAGTGRHITQWMDEFAAANRMSSCATPTDV